jgi:hypothetical protein
MDVMYAAARIASVDKSDNTVVWSITSPVGTGAEDMAVVFCVKSCSAAVLERWKEAMPCRAHARLLHVRQSYNRFLTQDINHMGEEDR